jgi:hypothetical protein
MVDGGEKGAARRPRLGRRAASLKGSGYRCRSGSMSIAWMCVVPVLILRQKLLPPRASIDVLLAIAIMALGVLVVLAPSAVPMLTARCERQ